MKRAVLYTRVSTCDQNPETQALDLRRLAEQRGFEIVHEYTDRISGAKAKRPALDQMMAAAHRREFETVLVWAADRLARSVRHFLEVLDTLNHLGIEFVSFRENLDTGGPLGRAVVIIVSAVAELERNLIIERVRAGLRRARLEGRVLGRKPLEIDRPALVRDRGRGLSLAQLAKVYKISRTSVARALKQSEAVTPQTPFLPTSVDIVSTPDKQLRIESPEHRPVHPTRDGQRC
jgi:DNA invertase Pin-like site-specific DNA recombinase